MTDCIQFIKQNATEYPERTAVIDGDRKVSYKDFINIVDSISYRLHSRSRKPKVVFDLKQGIEAYALIVAVLNVGGIFCPLNPDAPLERKLQIIGEFKPDFIVVETELKAIELNNAAAISIETLLHNKYITSEQYVCNAEDIIYIIYTSGTTGVPKGVMICRKALNKFLEWSIPTYGAAGEDNWGQFSFLSFDLSIVDIFTCLCSGATLFAMNDLSAKKNRPAGIIEKEKITIWHSVPSVIEFMMVNEKTKTYDFSSLKIMTFCGEPLKGNQVEFLFKKKNDLRIFNTYGPTEGTLFCTWQEFSVNNFTEYLNFTMSIGKPIPGWNLELVVVEDSDEKEVIIYGDYIGKGYLANPSDVKFKQMEIEGKTVAAFETGDLVSEKKGNLYFSSRKDRQVKIKGFRIELEEIDFRINQFLGRTSATVVKKGSLYSFIEGERMISDDDLRQFLKKNMEAYKIPNAFYSIKEIPRSANQKIDVNALLQLIP